MREEEQSRRKVAAEDTSHASLLSALSSPRP